MKKLLATILALVMALSLCTSAWATETSVAEVGEQAYSDFGEALTAWTENGGTLKLLDNVTAAKQIVVTKDLTLDLNGYTLTAGVNRLFQLGSRTVKSGNLVITDTSADKNGQVYSNKYQPIYFHRVGTSFTLEAGLITCDYQVDSTHTTSKCGTIYAANRAVTITINGGEVRNTGSKNGYAIYAAGTTGSSGGGNTKISVTDGAVTSSMTNAILISDGHKAEITGGTISGGGASAPIACETETGSACTITGGTFSGNVSDYVPDNTPVATVSTQGGGNTYVVGSEAIADAANNDANVTIIKGGAISGVNEGVTIVVDKEVKGVTINNVPVEENKTYIVPAKPSSGGYYYYPSTPGITAELNGTNKSATDYPGGDYGLVFRSTAAFSTFQGVQVDGKTLAKSNYTAEEGSTVVYLKAAYLKTLAAGKHTITILSTAGNTSMDFTIGGKSSSPKTFDAGIGIYAVTAVLSVTGMAWTAKKRH